MIKNRYDKKKREETGIDPEGLLRVSLVNQGVSIRKKRQCPLKDTDMRDISYKNLALLNRFVSDCGKVLPSRVTAVSARKQRRLKRAIKVARNLALLSFTSKDETLGE